MGLLLTLALAAPAAAKPSITYDAATQTYTFTGTKQIDELTVEPAKSSTGLEFYSLIQNPGLDVGPEALCKSLGQKRKQCDAPASRIRVIGGGESDRIGVPEKQEPTLDIPMTIDGGPGYDDLWGGRGDDILVGGEKSDQLSPGLGADTVIGDCDGCKPTTNFVTHFWDGRDEGIDIEIAGVEDDGPDPGDRYFGVTGVEGTKLADRLVVSDPEGFALGAAGDDFIDARGSGGAACGRGDDVAASTERPEGCEHAGTSTDPADWVSGFLTIDALTAGFTENYEDEKLIDADVGFDAQCTVPKPDLCSLRFKVTFRDSDIQLSSADDTFKRGDYIDELFKFTLTDAQYRKLRKVGKQDAVITAQLT